MTDKNTIYNAVVEEFINIYLKEISIRQYYYECIIGSEKLRVNIKTIREAVWKYLFS